MQQRMAAEDGIMDAAEAEAAYETMIQDAFTNYNITIRGPPHGNLVPGYPLTEQQVSQTN